MKNQIRNSVFETNSSSVHSVVIQGKSTNYTPSSWNNKVEWSDYFNEERIAVELGEFGWGYDYYSDAYTKLQYLLTMICEIYSSKQEYCDGNDIKAFLDAVYTSDDFINLSSIINDKMGYSIFISPEPYYNDFQHLELNGYIDHQSVEYYNCLNDFLADWHINSIEDFIFDCSISLIIDNDNH